MVWNSQQRLAEIRARLAPVRAWLAPHIEQGRRWLDTPCKPLTWINLRRKLTTTNGGRLALATGVVVLLLLLLWVVLPWYARPGPGGKGAVTYPHASLINPILGGLGALLLIYAAIRQARTASEVARTGNRQAEIASRRHVTDTFGKAVEQLSSDKFPVSHSDDSARGAAGLIRGLLCRGELGLHRIGPLLGSIGAGLCPIGRLLGRGGTAGGRRE